jgi:NAD(P)H-flavin reductase
MNALCQQWEQDLPNFTYVPVVSNAQAEDHWSGRTGFVHRAVMEDFPDLSGHQVYACGAPIVVESAQRDFSAQCGCRKTSSTPTPSPPKPTWPRPCRTGRLTAVRAPVLSCRRHAICEDAAQA